MTEEKLTEISDKLDKLIRLQAITVVKAEPSEQAKISLLDSLGFKPSEIAKMLNKTPENVSVVLGNLRKKKEGQRPTSSPQQPTLQSGSPTAPTAERTTANTSEK